MEEEKERMKERMFAWGRTLEQCRRRQEEMKRLGSLRLIQRQMWLGCDSEKAKEVLEQIDEEYNGALRRIQREIEELLREKAEMDRLLSCLKEEERLFVQLRYEEGDGFDYIAYKLHISRATAFRMQERILRRLAQVETP